MVEIMLARAAYGHHRRGDQPDQGVVGCQPESGQEEQGRGAETAGADWG